MNGVPNPFASDRRIRAVLFDLDGTLYRQAPLRRLMALELLALPLSRPGSTIKRLKALSEYRRAQEHLRTGAYEGSIPEAQVAIAARLSGLPVAVVSSLVEEWMMTRPLKYLRRCRVEGLGDVLSALKARGVPAGVLSDYPAQAKLRALGLDGCFSPVLCTTDPGIGALKPSPRGFLRACEHWGLPPEDVLFVGDRADVDGAGAAAAGMPCMILEGSTSMEGLRRVFDESR